MRIRQFTASTTAEALRELRETLGEDALVLSTRSEPGGVVITAAVEVAGESVAPRTALPQGVPEPITGARSDADDDLRFDLALIRAQLEQLGRRMQRMDGALLELAAGAATLGEDARALVQRLVASGLGAHLAHPVARTFEQAVASAASETDALRASLLQHVAVTPPCEARIEAFVGPTGSGKTTTIAKLAALAARDTGVPPALIVADDHRVGAEGELGGYARLIGAPLRVARDADELAGALAELSSAERILIDTAGLAGDAAGANAVRTLLAGAGAPVSVTAVVSATSSLRALQRVGPRLASLGAERAVVTKLDECDEPGVACTWLAEAGLPLAWLATGRRVPDDLGAASGDDLVRFLVAA